MNPQDRPVDVLPENEKVDPAEVEKKMIEQQSVPTDPTEYAAMMYKLYVPVFRDRVDKLSSRAKTRVLKSMIEMNLGDKVYKHTQDELETVMIGQALFEAKFVLSMESYNSSMKTILEAADNQMQLSTEDIEKLGLTEIMGKEKLTDTENSVILNEANKQETKPEELNG
jgi:hypothetical protein